MTNPSAVDAAGESLDAAGIRAAFDHVAVAAPRLRDLLPIYHGLLGGQYIRGGDNARTGYRALQLSYANGHRVELMEPLGGSTFFDSFFARSPAGGLHHVTFKVDRLEEALDAARSAGLQPVHVRLDDPAWRECFLHPREAQGVLIQFAESNAPLTMPGSVDQVLAGKGNNGTGVPSP